MNCGICRNSTGNKAYEIREMMFGLRERFSYTECGECGCLQIDRVPDCMDRYYPAGYYSLNGARDGYLKRRAIFLRDRYLVLRKGLLGRFLAGRYPNGLLQMLGESRVKRDSRVREVGSGAGFFLSRLRELGFTDLTGVDPFMSGDVVEEGYRLLRKTIQDLGSEKFNVILFNHSLEHMPDQPGALRKAAALLARDGICLVRMPVKEEYIWTRYGVDWVQIDAPRHLYLHTIKSFSVLARGAGLHIKDTVFDSTEFQFWGSEQYKSDIPLEAYNSYEVCPGKSMFTRKQIGEYRQTSRQLNTIKQGDQAAFLLVKAGGEASGGGGAG